MELQFLGAAGCVTGSKYLLSTTGVRILVDCGLFQGPKALRLRNWDPPAFAPDEIDAVLLTHAHIDHTGYLPALVKNGFSGPVYCTAGTRDLCGILLPDSGYLQEEEAKHANKYGYSKHKPALPLYTRKEAEQCLQRFAVVSAGEEFEPADGLRAVFTPVGHILGAACIRVSDGHRSVLFSGDVGRSGDPVMRAPQRPGNADYLVTECTYGNRVHDPANPKDALADIIVRGTDRGGVVVIPSFAIGRAQTLLHLIAELRAAGNIPDVPVFLDSPMAINATKIFCRHQGEHRLSEDACREMCSVAEYVNTPQASKALDAGPGPMVIVSASGMATGGRVLHHLKAMLPDANNLVLLVGFQAPGTRGASLGAGATTVKIHGESIPVRAEVIQLNSLSAHADKVELGEWLRHFNPRPKRTFLTHGEPVAAKEFRRYLRSSLKWSVRIPKLGDKVSLD